MGVKRVSVSGAREIKARIDDIIGALNGEEQTRLGQEINRIIGAAAEEIAEQARANARAQGIRQSVIDAIFTYNKLARGQSRRRNTALVGVARGPGTPSYTEWAAASKPGTVKSKDGSRTIVRKVKKGDKIGMSEAAMEEFGTSNRMPRPFFYPALRAKRNELRMQLGLQIREAIEKYTPKAGSQALK